MAHSFGSSNTWTSNTGTSYNYNRSGMKEKKKRFVRPFGHMEYKEFVIPKKDGKDRKICAPNAELKRFQRTQLSTLYTEYENMTMDTNVHNVAHGFIPGRNVVSAAQQHVGFKCTTMLDISNFFDTVSKDMIPKHIDTDKLLHKDGYCAQGFVTSPILACIATVAMMENIHRELTKVFKTNFAFTVYADDIQISTNRATLKDIKKVVDIVRKAVIDAGFTLNEAKTRTRYSKFGYRRILGVNVGQDHFRATRKTMRKIRAARQGGNKSSLGGLVTWSKCMLPNNPS